MIDTLDLRGLKCPLPALKAGKMLATMPAGSRLRVDTSDPLAVIDIPHMCSEEGHRLIDGREIDGGHSFFIERGG